MNTEPRPKLDSEMMDILEQCYRSTKSFAKVFMPDRFWRPFNSIHDQIFEVLDNDSIKKAVIAAPRGIGKTTIMDILLPAKKIVYQDTHYSILIGASNTHAEQQTENLKDELVSNEKIRELFGEMKSGSFSKEKWVTGTGVMVMPRGAGQQVRGLLHGLRRPDLIIIDDLENDEAVMSPEQRLKLKNWLFSAVVNSVDKGMPYRIIMIGTVLHEDALLSNLLEDPDWEHIRLSICGPDFKSNYPELMSDADIQAELKSYRDRGQLDVFYREYMNLPMASENQTFTQTMFSHYDERDLREDVLKGRKRIENVLIIDPAKTVSATADYSAILVAGIDTVNGTIYIRDTFMDRVHPDQLLDKAFDMALLWRVRAMGIEVTSLNEFITYPLKNLMVKRKCFFDLIELKARDKKENRIGQLRPLYAKGMVKHRDNGCCTALEMQLMAYPRSKYDDMSDCAAYLIEMLDVGERYLEDPEALEQEFAELASEKLEPLGESWCCI